MRSREEFKMNVAELLAKFLVQPNTGEPSREIRPEIPFGNVVHIQGQKANPTEKDLSRLINK